MYIFYMYLCTNIQSWLSFMDGVAIPCFQLQGTPNASLGFSLDLALVSAEKPPGAGVFFFCWLAGVEK